MTKDDIKNRISLALKDPVLQQGFEVICRDNTELRLYVKALEKANNTIINHCTKVNNSVISKLWKAREIIKNLTDSLITVDGEQVRELKAVKEAEQFLNSKIEIEE